MNQSKDLNLNPMSARFSDTLNQAVEKASNDLTDAVIGDCQLEEQTHSLSAIIDAVFESLRHRLFQKLRTKQG